MNPGEKRDCPKCNGVSVNITPLKNHDESVAIFGCQACGYAFKADGKAFVENAQQLRDVFRGATMANQTLVEAFEGDKMNPAARAMLTARLLEYGTQMWFDGLKQGILLGVTQAEKRK